VLVRDIEFAATCEETLMPFHGRCHVAYLPANESVLGLSKLARLVQAFSKRVCSQAGLTNALQAAISEHVPCSGVFVQMRAKHLADAVDNVTFVTEASSGCFNEPNSLLTKVPTRPLPTWS
jgi:GTP cyclohydrolase I